MNIFLKAVFPFDQLVYYDMGVFIPNIFLYEEMRLEEMKFPEFGYLLKALMTSKVSIAALFASFFVK